MTEVRLNLLGENLRKVSFKLRIYGMRSHNLLIIVNAVYNELDLLFFNIFSAYVDVQRAVS